MLADSSPRRFRVFNFCRFWRRDQKPRYTVSRSCETIRIKYSSASGAKRAKCANSKLCYSNQDLRRTERHKKSSNTQGLSKEASSQLFPSPLPGGFTGCMHGKQGSGDSTRDEPLAKRAATEVEFHHIGWHAMYLTAAMLVFTRSSYRCRITPLLTHPLQSLLRLN